MAFRFQKRIKIAPGVRINLSKSGASLSAGVRGATYNVGKLGTKSTVGIPGTGLSWCHSSGWAGTAAKSPKDELISLAKESDRQAATLNRLVEKLNSQTNNWNKAVEAFNSGRGPSVSKFNTLTKKYEAAVENNADVVSQVAELKEFIGAIAGRMLGLKFGMFGGAAKTTRDVCVRDAQFNQRTASDFISQISDIQFEIENEHREASQSIPK